MRGGFACGRGSLRSPPPLRSRPLAPLPPRPPLHALRSTPKPPHPRRSTPTPPHPRPLHSNAAPPPPFRSKAKPPSCPPFQRRPTPSPSLSRCLKVTNAPLCSPPPSLIPSDTLDVCHCPSPLPHQYPSFLLNHNARMPATAPLPSRQKQGRTTPLVVRPSYAVRWSPLGHQGV